MSSRTIFVLAVLLAHSIFFGKGYGREMKDYQMYRSLDYSNQHQRHPMLRLLDERMRRRLFDLLADDEMIKRGESTDATGNGQPLDNMQPSLVLNQIVTLEDMSSLFIVRSFGFNFFPEVPKSDGHSLSVTTNPYAFLSFGSTFGGNGIDQFNMPDLQGRAIIGAGQGDGLSSYQRGQKSGSDKITLNLNQMPIHDHRIGADSNLLTGRTGGSQPFSNIQPSLAMNYIICVDGSYPTDGGQVSLPFLGQIYPFVGTEIPDGWRLANGDSLPTSENLALFSIIGTTYGRKDSTSFQLPDLRGRILLGVTRLSEIKLGQKCGTESVQLDEKTLPTHAHILPEEKFRVKMTEATGLGQRIDNRQPSIGITYVVCISGAYAFRSESPSMSEDPILGEILAFAGNFAPGGFLVADGATLALARNSALFSLFGTTFGGNGKTTFQLPDLGDRTIIGSGGNFQIGNQLGATSLQLLINNLPSHTHTLP